VNKKTLTVVEFPARRTGIAAALPELNPGWGSEQKGATKCSKKP